MSIDASELFDSAMSFLVETLPTNSYDVDRPDYTSTTTSSYPVARGVNMRVEPGNSRLAFDIAPGTSYFTIRCDSSIGVLPGDIITPNDASGGAPILTVQNSGQLQTTLAFATNRVCLFTKKVTKATTYAIYENVPFDYIENPSPMPAINADNKADLSLATAQIVIFGRDKELSIGDYFVDSANPTDQYAIKQISTYGLLRVLSIYRFR